MKKKGFLFGIMPMIYLLLAIILLVLLIWFGVRISDGMVAVFSFLEKWWPWIAISVSGFLFRTQIQAIINTIFRKVGVKI